AGGTATRRHGRAGRAAARAVGHRRLHGMGHHGGGAGAPRPGKPAAPYPRGSGGQLTRPARPPTRQRAPTEWSGPFVMPVGRAGSAPGGCLVGPLFGVLRGSVAVGVPIAIAVVTGLQLGVAVALLLQDVLLRLGDLLAGQLLRLVPEVEAARPHPETLATAVVLGPDTELVLLRANLGRSVRTMLGEAERLVVTERLVTLGVATIRSPVDDTALGTVQQPLLVGTLQRDADPLGDD